MKKVLAIVLSALLLVAALAGCASKSETASNDTPASTDTAASTDGKLEVLKVGEQDAAQPSKHTARSGRCRMRSTNTATSSAL